MFVILHADVHSIATVYTVAQFNIAKDRYLDLYRFTERIKACLKTIVAFALKHRKLQHGTSIKTDSVPAEIRTYNVWDHKGNCYTSRLGV